MAHSRVTAAGKLLHSEARNEWKQGLVYEARKWCDKLGLPDPVSVRLSAEVVGMAVREGARKEIFEAVAASRTHNLMMTAARYFPNYIFSQGFTNLETKMIFSWKLGILQFKSRYKRLFGNTVCIYEGCDGEDSLAHVLEECEYSEVRKPRDREDYYEMLPFLMELHKERMEVGIPLIYI